MKKKLITICLILILVILIVIAIIWFIKIRNTTGKIRYTIHSDNQYIIFAPIETKYDKNNSNVSTVIQTR